MGTTNLKDFLLPVSVENSNNKNTFSSVAFNTQNFVYILSSTEMENAFSERGRRFSVSDWALSCRAYKDELYSSADRRLGAGRVWCRNACANDTICGVIPNGDVAKNKTSASNMGYGDFLFNVKKDEGVLPAIQLRADKIRDYLDMFKFVPKTAVDGEAYYVTTFGEYPQSKAKPYLQKELEKKYKEKTLKATGKEYYVELNGFSAVVHKEYEYNNKKYVRRACHFLSSEYKFSDGSHNSKGDEVWFEVEPIEWRVVNWKNLPKFINPQGEDSEVMVKLVSNSILINMPFYNGYADDKNCQLWQNSSVRGFLNGISVNRISNNGNLKYKANSGGDYTGKHNFLTEAFTISSEKTNEIEKEIIKKPRRGFGVEVHDIESKVKEQIEFYYKTKKSFMLHGPSGIGKTRRVEELDSNLTAIVLRNGILPEEVIGKTIYPNLKDTTGGIWVPPAWYVDLCTKCKNEPDKNHVLFIDEITNVKPIEQSLVYHLVLNNSIGPNYGKLPVNAIVVAAGNNKEESESAYNMPEPLFRRFDAHIYLDLDLPSWLEWGSEKKSNDQSRTKIHPLIASFVASNAKEVFYSAYDTDNPPKHAVDPRGWEQVSDILYDNNNCLSFSLIKNKVGDEIATSLVEFAKNPPLTIEDIIEENYTQEDIPETFDAKYSLTVSLRNVNDENLFVVRNFIGSKLGKELLDTFDNLWVDGDGERAIFLNEIKNITNKTQNEEETEREE